MNETKRERGSGSVFRATVRDRTGAMVRSSRSGGPRREDQEADTHEEEAEEGSQEDQVV